MQDILALDLLTNLLFDCDISVKPAKHTPVAARETKLNKYIQQSVSTLKLQFL